MPGEFEPQRAIVLSITDWMPHHYPILQQIVDKTSQHVNVLILYDELDQLLDVTKLLADSNPNFEHVYFSQLEMDTIWLRDFGPRLAELDNGWISIDFFYEGSRPRDDSFPSRWAAIAKTRLRTVRWTVQGGNLISNGAGLAIATNRIFSDNNVQFPNPLPGTNPQQEARKMVTKEFKRSFNLDQLVILEPLQQEATRHADMFATFLDSNRVLVARVDRFRDPINAAILDRNAARLQTARVAGRPLEVHRIDVPPREGMFWSPYTNIIMANKLLLMPTFDTDSKLIVQNAIATYQRLLPDYQIKTVDMTSMKTLQGSLHCLSLNLPDKAPWPKTYYSFKSTIESLGNKATGDE
ncbi:agmatine deiminase family protein [Stieleria marina]|uniref:agmatine deiminase family protein n=1 Tax=Stieleria marina TaxID=1930275 RepID=UPI003AF37D7D